MLIFAAQAGLSLPTVAAHLSLGEQEWQLWFAGALIIAFCVNHFVTIAGPYSRFLRFEAARLNILDQQVEPMVNQYRVAEKCDLRVNVMLSSRRIISWLEPWKSRPSLRKPAILKPHLSPAWVSSGMAHHSDSDLRLTSSQGVCGLAYCRKESLVADLTVSTPEEFNLNSSQVEKASGLRFVLSFPIRRLDPQTHRYTAEVVGVVNIDSRTEGAERLVRDPQAFNELSKKAEDVSALCSQLF